MPEQERRRRVSSLPNPEPGVLAAALSDGPDAFEPLFKMYWPILVRIAWGFFAPNRQEVEDAAMEAIEDVYRHLSSFEGRDRSKFSSWVFKVAQNRMLMIARRKRRRPRTASLGEFEELPGPTVEDELKRKQRLSERAALEEFEQDEQRAAFLELAYWISRLPDRIAQAMSLVRLCGLDPQAAAEVLGTSHEALRKRLSRGDKEVRRMRNEERASRGGRNGERR
ncbi:MAG: sigma-70 family RNA polymerase sigma factor [candidate division WOR-3 bacterium]